MTTQRYVLGIVYLGLCLVPIGFGAWGLRRRFLPASSGAIARLAETVLGLAVLIVVLQALGSIGLFRAGPVVIACAVVGVAVGMFSRRGASPRAEAKEETTPRAPGSRAATAVALCLVAIVAAQWAGRVAPSLDMGMREDDSLAQHMPQAARFVQEGWVTRLHFAPNVPTALYPADSELVHAFGILMVGSDLLSPLLNIGWMAGLLLAAWCVGKRAGVAPLTLGAGALLASLPVMVALQPGGAKNDVVALFFVLAAVALVMSDDERPTAPVALAGLAAGMAVATRLTSLVPVAALTVAVVVAAPRERRRQLGGAFVAGLVATGSFWYVRNLVRTGTLIPALSVAAGSASTAGTGLIERYGFSVAHYITDVDVWREWFVPGLRRAFGPAWFAVLITSAAGLIASVLSRRDRLMRLLAAVGILSAIGYLLTPTTAYGVEGRPVFFAPNLRYLTPALMIGLVLMPLTLPRTRVGLWSGLGIVGALVLVNQTASGVWAAWPPGYRGAAFAVGVGVLGLSAVIAVLRSRVVVSGGVPARRAGISATAALVAVALVATVGAGWRVQRRYVAGRYAHATAGRSATYSWARNVHDARIAFAGFWQHYPLYGLDLSNHVEYLGLRRPHGAFAPVDTCAEWRRLLREGRFNYVVTASGFDATTEPREASWIRTDPAAHEIGRSGSAAIFRITGQVDPTC